MNDWDDLRYVLAIARHGTLSAAARSLQVAQPTVGRRLDAFERRLGTRVFARRSDGLRLTAAGTKLFAHAQEMEQHAIAAERALAGRDAGISGTVRITASEWLVVRVLGPLLGPLLARHPALSIELVADARHLNLVRHEADLALRPREFEQDSIVQRKVARLAFGLYASQDYVARHGMPDPAQQCAGHVLIAMTDDTGDVARDWLATICANARIGVRTNGREPMIAMTVAGVGIACLPRIAADSVPGLVAIPTTPRGFERSLWLGAHRDRRSLPRVRAVAGYLATELRRLA